MKKWSFVALLILGAMVLGATVLREPLANAASSPFQNVIVTNTADKPVPVQDQAVTEFVIKQDVKPGAPLTVNVARYKQIRIAVGGLTCGGGVNDRLSLFAQEGGSTVARLEGWDFCSDDDSRTYEVPARTLQFVCFCGSEEQGHHVEVVIWGRTN